MAGLRGNSLFKLADRLAGVPLVLALGAASRLGNLLAGAPARPPAPGDRVLVVKLSALGDTLLLLPVLKALKARVGPAGRVVMVATPVNEAALRGCPWVDDLEVLPLKGLARDPLSLARFALLLRRRRCRVALDFDQWLRLSPLLCFLAGCASRFGFRAEGQHRHALYSAWIRNRRGGHEFEQFAALAGLAGIPREQVESWPGFLETHGLFRGAAAIRPRRRGPLVLIHPGCGSHGWQREWPAERWAELAGRLGREAGARFVVTGMGAHEEALAARVAAQPGLDVDNRAGKDGQAGLEGLASLLRRADLVACGNTGVMHLAVGLGRPLLALHGPTDPVKWGPLGWTPALSPRGGGSCRVLRANLPCSPCLNLGFEYGCAGRACMEAVGVDSALRACLELLGKARP